MEDINRILVVSRMTKYCQSAVRCGVSLARKYGASLSVIHVIHNPFGLDEWNLPLASFKKDYRKIFEEAKAGLDRIVREEREKGLAISEITRRGEPTRVILKTVKDEKIDLMILLAHEEGRLEHFLFGRSNEELVRRMPCSILFVKKEPLGGWMDLSPIPVLMGGGPTLSRA